MKVKKEYIILIAVIGVLSLYLALHKTDKTHYSLPEIPSLEKNTITRIEITGPEQSVSLKKTGDAWQLAPQGYPADGDQINAMLDILSTLSLSDLVSESESYARYDLQVDKRIHVRAWVGDQLKREVYVGRAAASFRHTFVKLEGDGRVFHARENFRSRFEANVEALRDKSVLSFETGDIQKLTVSKGAQVVQLVKQQIPATVSVAGKKEAQEKTEAGGPQKTELAWLDADGKPIDSGKIQRLLNSLHSLKCSAYLPNQTKEAFENPIYSVEITDSGTHVLSVFKKTEETAAEYPAVSSQNQYPFLVGASQAESFMTLFDPPESQAAAQPPKKK